MQTNKKFIFFISLYILFLFSNILFDDCYAQDKKEHFKFLKNLSLEELMDMKVTTAGKTEEKIADIPASFVLVTQEDIKKYGYNSLSEIIENIPGFYPINDLIGGSNFGVRGFWTLESNANMVYMVNGISQVLGGFAINSLNTISVPVSAINRIEVIRGPMTINYGSNAFYGAINIITNNSNGFNKNSSINGTIFSDGNYSISANHSEKT